MPRPFHARVSPARELKTSTVNTRTHAISREDHDYIFADRFENTAAARPVLERLTYGARPQDIDHFNALGDDDGQRLAGWVDQQLNWQALDDTDAEQRLAAAGYQTLDKTIEQLWQEHRLDSPPWVERIRPVAEVEAARMLRAVYSRRQLYEMLVEFWHDHFNVAGWEFDIAPIFVQYDRDVIRPHALGNFRFMLEEMAKSTAMMIYLDNRRNRSGGYNENFARELMELHTLGVDAYFPGAHHGHVPIGPDGVAEGYSDADVYDVARTFTGWTIKDGHWQYPQENDGTFTYRQAWHEGGSKFVLGQWISPAGQAEARTVMDRIAAHPATARHLCTKLCRRFIDDQPPPALIASSAEVWRQHWQSDDQITRVLRHILTSDELLEGGGRKVRRPWELLIAALRKTDAEIAPQHAHVGDWEPYRHMNALLRQAGHGPFRWPAPDGYPDTARRWTSVSVLGQCWRMLSRLPQHHHSGESILHIQSLTEQAFPAPATRTAPALVDWWTDRLIGRPVAEARRTRLIDFLRQDAAADQPLDLSSNAWGGAGNLAGHYVQDRLRATVSLIMTCPEFHLR